jgi:hypothetical protein
MNFSALADFLNLLDGGKVATEAKYQSKEVGKLQGSLVMTSNEPVRSRVRKCFDRRKYLVTSILAFLEPKLEISFSISGEITTEYL